MLFQTHETERFLSLHWKVMEF